MRRITSLLLAIFFTLHLQALAIISTPDLNFKPTCHMDGKLTKVNILGDVVINIILFDKIPSKEEGKTLYAEYVKLQANTKTEEELNFWNKKRRFLGGFNRLDDKTKKEIFSMTLELLRKLVNDEKNEIDKTKWFAELKEILLGQKEFEIGNLTFDETKTEKYREGFENKINSESSKESIFDTLVSIVLRKHLNESCYKINIKPKTKNEEKRGANLNLCSCNIF